MSIKGVLLRFLVLYTVLIVVAGLVMNHFGIKQNSGINVGILAGCVFWVCSAFGKMNGRYFSRSEKTAVVLGLVAIDITLQLLFTVAALSQSSKGVSAGALTFAIGFIGILHAIAIYFLIGLARKPLMKQGVIRE